MQTNTRPVSGYFTSSPGAMEISTGWPCADADAAAEARAADAAAEARAADFVCAGVEREAAGTITANTHKHIAAIFIGRENSKIGGGGAAVSQRGTRSV